MRNDDVAETREDLVRWSTPLIADCLGLAYHACLGGDEKLIHHFTQQHRRLWLSVVSNNPAKAAEARRPLDALAKLCQITDEAIQAIDEIVLDELTEVVCRRFQGSPAKTRSYSRLLMDAASVLTQARLGAAA